MIGLRRYVSVMFAAAFCSAVSASASDVRIGYSEPLEALSYARASGDFQKLGAPGVQKLSFNAFSRHFAITLTPNYRLLDAVGREALGPELQIYRGSLADSAGSWARIVIADGLPRGLVFDGKEMYAIEAEAGEARIFRLADMHVAPGALACGHAGAARNGAELFKTIIDETAPVVAAAQGATSQIDVAVVADFEFAKHARVELKSNAEAEMITRMNNVDGIFSSSDLRVQINVGRVDVFDSTKNPFTDDSFTDEEEVDYRVLLDKVVQFRVGSDAQKANGLTHLFTGHDLKGSTIGVAYVGELCDESYGAGLTQATFDVTTDSLIVAHELGHNFGAPHDGTMGSNCESERQIFLMSPSLHTSDTRDTFSNCSIREMEDDVSRASCITTLYSVDVAVAAGAQSGSVLVGDSAALTFDVTSTGTEAANDVTIAVSVPVGLALDRSSTTAGSCTDGAGSVDCTIGSLASGAGATVTVFVTAETTGLRDVTATVSATGDENAGNNTATTRFTVTVTDPVDPVDPVDLVASTPAAAQITINQSTTLRPSVENRSSIAASNPVVTIAPSAGLRIDSASWRVGNCTISGGQARCTATSLAANSTQTIAVQVTGVAEGQQRYTVSATADERDRNTSNNSSTSQVNVTAAPIDLVASTPAAAQITINQSTTLRPSVENRSSTAASNPVVTIAPSGGLRIDSASWPVGNCTISGGQARCTATSLAANSTQTIAVQVTGVAEGQQRYTVSATADERDRNTSNNSSTSQVNVTAMAIDLVASTPAAAQITINQSTTLRPSVENRSSTAASNPVVTIAPSAGLRIDSASWRVGNCTISGSQARCTATSLAANSTQTIEVQVTGVAEGQQRYTVSATADEDDRNTSNNSSTSQLNVTAVSTGPSGGEDSGGGSLGFAMLLLLFSTLVLRFRRRRAEAAGSVENSYDNALADKIIGFYKTELLRQRGPWKNIDDVEYATLGWIDWFNNRRLYQPIGDAPPAENKMAYHR